jgi:hypothetical protein
VKSSLLILFPVLVVTVRRERREYARILVDKHSLWALRCGGEGRYDSRRAGRRSCRYSGGSPEMRAGNKCKGIWERS